LQVSSCARQRPLGDERQWKLSSMDSKERAAIILAGSEKKGPTSVTRADSDRNVPKQFLRLSGESTVLERTRRRVALAFPPERTTIVVTRAHSRFYETLLSDVSPNRLVVQPRNRGTAPAMLYALFRSQKITRNSAVAVFPSHHYVGDDAAFMRHVDLAFEGVRARPDLLVLLGTAPDGPEVDYCWIEMGDRIGEYLQLFQIRGFWEKPSPRLAIRLWQSGCLWNSSVVVGRMPALLLLMRSILPQLTASFYGMRATIGTERESEAAEAIYETLPDRDFSHEVATRRPGNLAVLPVAGIEWSDLERPRRAIGALRHVGIRSKWPGDAFLPRSRK
jgi:mannose-1-phosphate guanylyltransferase